MSDTAQAMTQTAGTVLDLLKTVPSHLPQAPQFLATLIWHPGEAIHGTIQPFLHTLFVEILHFPETALHVIFAFMCANVMAGFVTVTALVLTLGERKVCAFFQNRKGPNR